MSTVWLVAILPIPVLGSVNMWGSPWSNTVFVVKSKKRQGTLIKRSQPHTQWLDQAINQSINLFILKDPSVLQTISDHDDNQSIPHDVVNVPRLPCQAPITTLAALDCMDCIDHVRGWVVDADTAVAVWDTLLLHAGIPCIHGTVSHHPAMFNLDADSHSVAQSFRLTISPGLKVSFVASLLLEGCHIFHGCGKWLDLLLLFESIDWI